MDCWNEGLGFWIWALDGKQWAWVEMRLSCFESFQSPIKRSVGLSRRKSVGYQWSKLYKPD